MIDRLASAPSATSSCEFDNALQFFRPHDPVPLHTNRRQNLDIGCRRDGFGNSTQEDRHSLFLPMPLNDGNDTCHRSWQDVEQVKLFRSQFEDARIRSQLVHSEQFAGGVEMIPECRPSYFIQWTDATLAMFRHDRDNSVIRYLLVVQQVGAVTRYEVFV